MPTEVDEEGVATPPAFDFDDVERDVAQEVFQR